MIRTEKVKTMDKFVLKLIPFRVFPDMNILINWIKDDMFFPAS